jgi:hypothetical protein
VRDFLILYNENNIKTVYILYYEPTSHKEHLFKTPKMETIFDFDKYYNQTKWGILYTDFQNKTQLQLAKATEHFENRRQEFIQRVNSLKLEKQQIVQHLFFKTELNTETNQYTNTPSIVKRGNNNYNLKQVLERRHICFQIYDKYMERQRQELDQVKAFYEQRKQETSIADKLYRKEQANAKICCDRCGVFIVRTNISKHKKSLKCLSHI